MGMTVDLVSWTHGQKCRRAVESLKKSGFTARYCAGTTIIDRKPRLTDLHVLAVNAVLGF